MFHEAIKRCLKFNRFQTRFAQNHPERALIKKLNNKNTNKINYLGLNKIKLISDCSLR